MKFFLGDFLAGREEVRESFQRQQRFSDLLGHIVADCLHHPMRLVSGSQILQLCQTDMACRQQGRSDD
ncbi:hypothetical protein D3C75_1168070 [compost metagenome]